MSSILTTTELRNMQVADLERDIAAQQAMVRKLRLGIQMNKEKDSAKYRREKRSLARLQTVLTEKKKQGSLLPKAKKSTVPARK